MIYCSRALRILLQKQVHRLRKAGATAGGRNGKGKTPTTKRISEDIMKMAAWAKQQACNLLMGRDIDVQKYPTDSLAMILNESALKVMKFKNPDRANCKRQWASNGM